MAARERFLAGERLDDVALFLADDFLDDPATLADRGTAERVPGGVILVVDGDRGRRVFRRATGLDAMAFARRAMDRDGRVAHDLTGATCPQADDGDGHGVRFVFAFAEAAKPDADDRYAEGDVIHAYAYCECGTAFSERWVAGE